MKSKEDEEFPASPVEGVEAVQRVIAAQEVNITVEEDIGLMPTTNATPFQLLPAIFQKKFPFMEMYQRLV